MLHDLEASGLFSEGLLKTLRKKFPSDIDYAGELKKRAKKKSQTERKRHSLEEKDRLWLELPYKVMPISLKKKISEASYERYRSMLGIGTEEEFEEERRVSQKRLTIEPRKKKLSKADRSRIRMDRREVIKALREKEAEDTKMKEIKSLSSYDQQPEIYKALVTREQHEEMERMSPSS